MAQPKSRSPLQSPFKFPWFGRGWVTQLLLFLLTVLLCVVVSPVFAKAPIPSATGPNLLSGSQQTYSLVQQGKTLYDSGQYAEAVKFLQQASQAYQAQGDSLKQATALSNLSLAYQQLGLWSEATNAVTDSLNLVQTGSKTASDDRLQVRAQILNTQGRLQWALGQHESALKTWQQATTTYTQAGDNAGSILSLTNQAQALQSLGLYRRAVTTLTQVRQALQTQPDSLIKTAGLRYLGNALRVVGDLNQSRQVLQQSLVMAERLRSPSETSSALLSLGNVARVQQDPSAAFAFYQKAATTSPAPMTKLQAQLNQLSLLLETQQVSAAETLWPQLQSQIAKLPANHHTIHSQIDFAQSLAQLKQAGSTRTPSWPTIAQLMATAVRQAKDLGDQRAEAYALGTLGGLYERTQQWQDAQDLTRQALLKAQSVSASDIAYRWQWQLGRLLKAQGNTAGAIATYTEAVNTLQSLRSDLVAVNPDVQFSFREGVEPVYRQLVELLLQPGGAEPSQQDLVQARTLIESLQLAELDNFFRAACLSAQPVLIDQVVDQDSPTAAVIYPIILPDRLEVILKLPQQQQLRHYVTQVPQSQVEATLTQLRQNLEKPYTYLEVKALSQQVYNWLIQPAEVDLAQSEVKTLVFVLDGSLRNIPMSVLYDGEQYLVQKYSVALTPGLQLLNPRPLTQVRLKALAAGLTEARSGFSALTNVALELNQIRSEVPSKVLLNRQFTSTALQDQINSLPFPVVHLATHGQFSSNPDQTFILAWDKPIKVNELSNLLQQPGDPSKPNTIELLVLSACETAAGDRRAALGLAGVAVRSGARSTLASLWNLDDESSPLLLSQFYRELAKTSITKAEALRQAQLALLQDPTYRHPLFWAPYVLVGNWL